MSFKIDYDMFKVKSNINIKNLIYFIIILLLITDLGFSFLQHYNTVLDGDMAGGIVPANNVQEILDNPLGVKVITEKTAYVNPNRFFSHWIFYKYFNLVPFILQKVTDPINSIYLSCAIIKTLIQLGLIIILSLYISCSNNLFKSNFIISAFIITPLFQTNGYYNYMGIIDNSTTYVFFYALPTLFLLVYIYPLFKFYVKGSKIPRSWIFKILWTLFALIICLSGPLNPGIILIAAFLIFISAIIKNYKLQTNEPLFKKITRVFNSIYSPLGIYIIPISIFAIYSLYIGRFNSISNLYHIPLVQLYLKLPKGIFFQFTQKLGFPILFLSIILNLFIYRSIKSLEAIKNLAIYKWIALFAVLYIFLLPFGGFRPYRTNILRYDTVIPFTICMIFIFGHSTLFLFKQIDKRFKIYYSIFILIILFIFTNADDIDFHKTDCERNALTIISNSNEKIVKIEKDCPVLTWNKIQNPKDSELNSQLLQIWNITNEKKLYFNQK